MTESKIRDSLAIFCKTGEINRVKAIYDLVKDDIMEPYTDDDSIFTELDKREKSFTDGSAKMYTWEETKIAAIEMVKSRKANGTPNKNTP